MRSKCAHAFSTEWDVGPRRRYLELSPALVRCRNSKKKRPHSGGRLSLLRGVFHSASRIRATPGRGVPCVGSSDAGSDDFESRTWNRSRTVKLSPGGTGRVRPRSAECRVRNIPHFGAAIVLRRCRAARPGFW